MKTRRHHNRGHKTRDKRPSSGQASAVLKAIRKAFPDARAAKVELFDSRGQVVAIAAELLPVVNVG